MVQKAVTVVNVKKLSVAQVLYANRDEGHFALILSMSSRKRMK